MRTFYIFLLFVFSYTSNIAQAQSWEALYNLGDSLFNKANKPDTAILVLEKALLQAEKEFGKDTLYAKNSRLLAVLYNVKDNYSKAEQLCLTAAAIYKEKLGERHIFLATIYHTLAYVCLNRSQYTEAERWYKIVCEIKKNVLGTENESYAASASSLGLTYVYMENFEEAEYYLMEALAIRERISPPKGVAMLENYINMAGFYSSRNEFNKSEFFYQKVLTEADSTISKQRLLYSKAASGYSSLLTQHYRLDEALFWHKKASYITKTIFSEHSLAYLFQLHKMAEINGRMTNYIESEQILLNCLEKIEKLGINNQITIDINLQLSNLYSEFGNIEKSIFYAETALENVIKIVGKESQIYANTLGILTNRYIDKKLFKQAEILWNERLGIILKKHGAVNTKIGISYNVKAVLCLKREQYDSALVYAEKSMSVFKAVSDTSTIDYLYALNSKGHALMGLNQIEEAERVFRHAREKYFKIPQIDKFAYGVICYKLAEALYQLKRYDDGLVFSKELSEWTQNQLSYNFAFLSEQEKTFFAAKLTNNIKRTNSILISSSSSENVRISGYLYNNLLLTKAILFSANKQVLAKIYASGDSLLQNVYYKWMRVNKQVAIESQKTKQNKPYKDSLLNESNVLEKQINRLASNIGTENYACKVFSWQDVQKKLGRKEAIVEIYRFRHWDGKNVTDSCSYAALVLRADAQSPELVLLAGGQALENEYLQFYNNCIRFDSQDDLSYSFFWQPIKDKLKGIKKVYFCNDGAYFQLNLQTLKNPKTGRYLQEEVEIQLLSSSRDLLKVSQNKQNQNYRDYKIYLFGYPNYSGKNDNGMDIREDKQRGLIEEQLIAPIRQERFFNLSTRQINVLPGTKTEIENIAKTSLSAKIRCQVRIADEASEENLKALKSPDVLHIATHGFFIPLTDENVQNEVQNSAQNPLLRSGLLLANAEQGINGQSNDNTENGIVTALEIINLDFHQTDLVVLSACETGLGEVENGEGVFGLQRAFQQAGAKSVLISLWKVDDVATQELMSLFYRNLLLKKQTKRTAFNSAQKQLQKKYPSPYYWGAFMMVGE